VVTVDQDGIVRQANRACQELTGRQAEELRGQHFADVFLPAEERLRTEAAFRRVMTSEVYTPFVNHWLDRQGRKRRIVWSGSVLHGPDGASRYLLCTGIDMTAQRHAEARARQAEVREAGRQAREEALRHSEARFRSIISLASDAIVSANEKREIVLFNRAAENLFGYREADVLGRPIELLFSENLGRKADLPATRPTDQNAAHGPGRDHAAEVTACRQDGTTFPAEVSSSEVEVDEQRISTVIMRNIAPRLRARAAERFLAELSQVLSASLELDDTLRSVARLAVRFPADICAVELGGPGTEIRHLEVASADPADEELVHRLADLGRDGDRPSIPAKVLDTGTPHLVECASDLDLELLTTSEKQLTLFRELRPRSFLVVPVGAAGQVRGTILLLTRGTGRLYDGDDVPLALAFARRAGVAVENALLYRSAQKALAARDALLNTVSHDLGNQLQAAGMILDRLEGLLTRGELEKAVTLVSAGRRSMGFMNRLLRDFLEGARTEAGHLHLSRRPCSVELFVEETMNMLEPLARARSVQVEMDLDPERLPRVDVDQDRVAQALSNLLGNAIRYTPSGGLVTIRARPGDGEVGISVEDTGPGIPPEDLDRVFDRFWRANDDQAKRTGGVGLGLAIARGIVRSHGGSMWAESDPGKGSRFHFTLPVAGASAADPGAGGFLLLDETD
jgi:PAS domain S-box-containing protein